VQDNPAKFTGVPTAISFSIKIDCVHPPSIATIINIYVDLEALLQPTVVGQMRLGHFNYFVELVEVRSCRVRVSIPTKTGRGAYGIKYYIEMNGEVSDLDRNGKV